MRPVIVATIISGIALLLSGGWTALVAFMTLRNGRATN